MAISFATFNINFKFVDPSALEGVPTQIIAQEDFLREFSDSLKKDILFLSRFNFINFSKPFS